MPLSSETCLDRTISRSHYDPMETRRKEDFPFLSTKMYMSIISSNFGRQLPPKIGSLAIFSSFDLLPKFNFASKIIFFTKAL